MRQSDIERGYIPPTPVHDDEQEQLGVPLLPKVEDKREHTFEEPTSPRIPTSTLMRESQSASPVAPSNLPDLPNAARLWQAEYRLMLSWVLLSGLALIVFSPFFLSTGLFLSAAISAVISLLAGGLLVFKNCSKGIDLGTQVRLAQVGSQIAFSLDILIILMDLLILFGFDCTGDDLCESVMSYVTLFTLYLVLHAALSYRIHQRTKDIMQKVNPVSSGMVDLERAVQD